MKIKKILSISALAAILVIPFCLQANVQDTHICKGSGEDCMTVDLGKGMTATFVKTKGSPAVVIKD